MSSSDNTAATSPTSVIIPAGSTSATVTINAVNDSVADGSQVATISAQSSGFVFGNALITVTDDEIPSLSLSLSLSAVPELNGVSTATVRRNTPTTSSLLTSSDTTAVTLSLSVTIPAGLDFVSFVVAAVNDVIADGDQISMLTATATGLLSGTAQITVVDDEAAQLTIAFDRTSLSENGGFGKGTVRRNTPTTAPLNVPLLSDSISSVVIPTALNIPAGADSATFDLNAVDDAIANGNRLVVVTASAAGLASGVVSITVVDDETAQLVLTLDNRSISENGGFATATVRRNSQTTNAMNVILVSSDTTAATVPATVVIPAGFNTATFLVTAANDTLADGDQLTTLSASASGQQSGTIQITVVDDEVPELSLTFDKTSIAENGGRATGTIRRNTPTSSSLLVALNQSSLSFVVIPTTVTIPTGSSSVVFELIAADDTIASGDRDVNVTVSAAGITSAVNRVTVIEDDLARLLLSQDSRTLSENGGTALASVTRNTPTDSALSVSITSSDLSAATVPLSVAIPAGSTSATFIVSAVNDSIADSDQFTNVTVSSGELATASTQVTVVDDEIASLTLSLDVSSISEQGGVARGTVRRNTPTTNSLSVTLSRGISDFVSLLPSVTIPSGAAFVDFDISAIDDTIAVGDRVATLSASAAGPDAFKRSNLRERLDTSYGDSQHANNIGADRAALE